jgi:cytochrome b6-f complex iron-sulfur subunit
MLAQVHLKEPLSLKDVDTKRRFFVRSFVKFLPYFGAGTFIYPLVKYARFEEVSKISLTVPLSEINSDIVKIDKVLIQKKGDQIVTYSAHCTHMGCVLNIDETKKRFVCPCHSSEFSFDGRVLKGPATRDLDIIPSRIEDNILYIG